MRIAKVISAFVGVLMVLGSLGVAGAGMVALTAADDTDGFISAGPVRISTDAAALVGDDIDIGWPSRLDVDGLSARLQVDSRNGKEVFVGIGPAAEVDRYLEGVRHATVEVVDGDVVLRAFDGSNRAPAPEGRELWVTADQEGTLVWDVDAGRWALAVLNADGSPGVDVEVTAAARVPFIRSAGVVLVVVGLIGLAIGATLTYFGVRSTPGGPTPPVSADTRPEVTTS